MRRRQPAAALLDTHAWFWLVNGDDSLSEAARTAIADAAKRTEVHVSAISAW